MGTNKVSCIIKVFRDTHNVNRLCFFKTETVVEVATFSNMIPSKCINIRNTYNNAYDVDRVLTNVTIKDAPYELCDIFLIENLRKY